MPLIIFALYRVAVSPLLYSIYSFNIMDFKKYLVTAALPYANGPVHIGHLAGCYLPADIYVRYQRSRKRDVKFICGTD